MRRRTRGVSKRLEAVGRRRVLELRCERFRGSQALRRPMEFRPEFPNIFLLMVHTDIVMGNSSKRHDVHAE